MKALKNFIFALFVASVLTVSGAAGVASDNWQKEPPPRKPPERVPEPDKKRDEPKRDEKKKPNNYF